MLTDRLYAYIVCNIYNKLNLNFPLRCGLSMVRSVGSKMMKVENPTDQTYEENLVELNTRHHFHSVDLSSIKSPNVKDNRWFGLC